jgi:hypothetical protein
MADVADSPFEVSVQWDETSRETIDALVQVGSACGDDEELMRAKADRICQLLREILEDTPSLQITATLPPEFSEAQVELVATAIRRAATAGIQAAAGHAAEALAEAMYDLCTSKLRHVRN